MAKQGVLEWLNEQGVDTSAVEAKLKRLGDSQAEKRDWEGKVLAEAVPPSLAQVEAVVRPFLTGGALNALAQPMANEWLASFRDHPGIDYPKAVAETNLEKAVKAVLDASAVKQPAALKGE